MKCKACNGTGNAIDHRKVGQAFKMKREGRSMTQRDVAMKMNISIAYLSDLENGRRSWNSGLMASYERALR